MNDLYLVEDDTELKRLRNQVQKIKPEFEKFLEFLKENYEVRELPRCLIWTDFQSATNFISDIPLPAYTNDYRTVMVPDIDVWKKLYLRQLEGYAETEVTAKLKNYYHGLSTGNLLQILGHEMVHHSELFLDEAYERETWFEEGMAEYISRKYFLTPEAYRAEKEANRALVALYEAHHGQTSPNNFMAALSSGNIGQILSVYWKSFLLVDALVEARVGGAPEVFASYQRWYGNGAKEPLPKWFGLSE